VKYAILADIHANLEALEAVLIAAENEGADHFIAVGDIVGYGADPVACINRLRENEFVCVLGDHDQALVDGRQVRSFNALARNTILRSRDLVSEVELDYIRHFGFRHVEFDAVFAHANPIRPENWLHMILHRDIAWCLERLDWRVAFVGHTHYPGIYCGTGSQVTSLTSSEVSVGPHRYLINPGSVGQPRDGDRRASYALWDVDAEYVQLLRVEYPVERTQEKLRQADWPEYLAERLGKGE
jgi:predicted phosphodiesterase